jgi:monoterpene epsilon-lactone hydrolase
MSAKTHLSGPNSYRIKLLSNLSLALAETVARRVRNGPLLPGWNWAVELTTEVLRRQLTTAFNLPDINEARRFLDSFELFPATPGQLRRTPVPTGEWFEVPQPAVTVLYFHGGGYTFYPRAYSYFLAHIAQAAHARLFALDYRLAPEHKFPAQLNDAIAAYTRLLAEGVSLNTLVIAGDSAGGHLALGCLLKLRELRLPLPALTVALSPPPDFQTEWPSFVQNARFDWIERPMLEKWADCFCSPGERTDPLISLVKADFRSLCPIYIQFGEAEILRDSIQDFAKRANAKQANIIFESWPEMNHVFQIFGSYAPQSAAALSQIGKVIADTVLLKQNCVLPR